MAILGLVTNEGISKSIEAQNNEGFKIKPIKFSVAETAGDLNTGRDESTVLPVWYEGPISGFEKVSDNEIVITCSIPKGSASIPMYTREVYIYAADINEDPFLLLIAQPSAELTYDPEGELKLKITFKIANINLENVYQFLYTQAEEVSDHNVDPLAHPLLQAAMNKAGIYVQEGDRAYNGQHFDQFPAMSPAVTNLQAVWFNPDNNRYERAIANDGPEADVIGLYMSAKNIVVFHGIVSYPHSLEPYRDLYLSTSLSGQLEQNVGAIRVGYTLPNNKLFVSITRDTGEQSDRDLDGDYEINLEPPLVRELTLEDDNGVKWDVKIDDDGLAYTVPYSIREVDAPFRIMKPNLSFGQLVVKTDGELQVASPPDDPSAILDNYYYLASPNGMSWKLALTDQNELWTRIFLNTFLIKSESDRNHFAVRQTSGDRALTYIQTYTRTELPTTASEINISGSPMQAWCFLNDGGAIQPIFWDGLVWRYFKDNSLV